MVISSESYSDSDALEHQDKIWQLGHHIVGACNGKLNVLKLRADLWATSKQLYKVSMEIKEKAKIHFPMSNSCTNMEFTFPQKDTIERGGGCQMMNWICKINVRLVE